MQYTVVEDFLGVVIVQSEDGDYARRCGKCKGVGFYEVQGDEYNVYSCSACKADRIVGKKYSTIEELKSAMSKEYKERRTEA